MSGFYQQPNQSFQQNSNQFNGQNDQKPKSNFRLLRIKGIDAQADIGTWNSQSGVFVTMIFRSKCGEDPSNHAPIYENKSPSELPSFYMALPLICQFNEVVSKCPWDKLDFTIGFNSKLHVQSVGNDIKLTIEKDGKNRTFTCDGITLNDIHINAHFINICRIMKIAYRRALIYKADDDEFGTAISMGDADQMNDDTPF